MICSGSFVSPMNGATLTVADDLNKSCSGSLHINVSLATSADDGTNVDLYVGSTKVDTQKVSGAEVHFMNVQLPKGTDMLQAVFSATLHAQRDGDGQLQPARCARSPRPR